MGADERLSGLIGDIYDAALDDSLWPHALESVYRFVGGSGAGIHSRDAGLRGGKCYYEAGTEPGYSQLYFDRYVEFDPMNAAYHILDVGEVTSNSLLIPQAEFIQTRFYKEWVRPQGWIDNIMVTLEKSATSHAAHVVFRHERDGIADEAARRRMRLIVPHLRRAVLIGNVIDLKAAEAATFADALDGLSAGIFLVDAAAQIVHANAAGRAMLEEGDYLRAAGGRLIARDMETERSLTDIFAAADGGDEVLGTKGIAMPLISRDGERFVARVLPLTSGERRRTGETYRAVAALFVHKAALDTPSPPEVIAKTFRLTPTELRVLLAIVEVGGVPEVAKALGIGETTVKTHLGRLYGKTGTGRQADLVKLVAGYSSPLHG